MKAASHSDEETKRGFGKIKWARRSMQVSEQVVAALKPNAARHIGVSQFIDANIATFCVSLKERGYDVSVYHAGGDLDVDLAAAMKTSGITFYKDVEDFIKSKPHIILDATGDVLKHLDEGFLGLVTLLPKAYDAAVSLYNNNALSVPTIDLSRSILPRLAAELASGQSSVMAFLDITNLQLAGRFVLVLGYSAEGQSVAAHAAGLGARVCIVESDPILALKAFYAGYAVQSIAEAAAVCEVVFATDESDVLIEANHVKMMPDGVILCKAGAGEGVISCKDYLDALEPPKDIRAYVKEYRQENGKIVKLIAEGQLIARYGAEGKSSEITDIYTALQAVTIQTLSNETTVLTYKIHQLPIDAQLSIVRKKLEALT